MSKLKLRVPTKDQYAFVEVETDFDTGTAEQVKSEYDKLFSVMNNGQKVSELAFNDILIKIADSDLTEWQMDADFYSSELTDQQRKVIQSLKKFVKRLPVIE